MSEYCIRPFDREDWKAVAAIYAQGIATGIATFQTEVPSLEQWDKGHIKEPRIVAEYRGEVAGFAALSPVSVRECYRGVAEVSVYVAENFRNLGVGKLLLSRLVALSEGVGIWTLQSSIDSENLSSIRVHLACGFREVGFRERIASDRNGVWRDTLLMERRSNVVGR